MTNNKSCSDVNILSLIYTITLILFILCSKSRAGTVAWFYALDSDKVAFEKVIGKPLRTVPAGACSIHEYRVGPHRVVAAKMGSGCVNTTATVSTVLALNAVDRVISTGPAGGLTAEAERGTWLRVREVMAWQSGKAAEDGRIFPSEKALMPLAYQQADWPAGEWREARPAKLVSGEAFIASTEMRSRLAADYAASAVEMNAYGLLAGIEGRNVKLLVLRIVSDHADEKASEDFAAFLKSYDGKGGAIVAEIIQKLPAEPNEPAAHDALRELLK
jgi:adenosylhomocysteine nucleosidase